MKKLVVGLAVLAVAALALLASHTGPATPASAVDFVYTVNQPGLGGGPVVITPLAGGGTDVVTFYNYGNPPCIASANTNLELANTSQLFLYDGPGGVSLVMIHDLPGCDQNSTLAGKVDFLFDGVVPDTAAFVVKDDPGDSYTDTATTAPTAASWGWLLCCTDGGAIGFLECPFEITITPDFHPTIGTSPIDTWIARSDSVPLLVTFPSLTEPVTITCTLPIGGIVELRADADTPAEASGSSTRDYTTPIAAAVAVTAVLALVVGGWYARRRLLR